MLATAAGGDLQERRGGWVCSELLAERGNEADRPGVGWDARRWDACPFLVQKGGEVNLKNRQNSGRLSMRLYEMNVNSGKVQTRARRACNPYEGLKHARVFPSDHFISYP